MKPPIHSPQIHNFIKQFNELKHIKPYYAAFRERECVWDDEGNFVRHHHLHLHGNSLIYQIWQQAFDAEDADLYHTDETAFFAQIADKPCEIKQEWAFSSVEEFAYHLTHQHGFYDTNMALAAQTAAAKQIQAQYEQQFPQTDWCKVSLYHIEGGYCVPRHEFATTVEQRQSNSKIELHGIAHYFKKDTLVRLIKWENRFIAAENAIYQQTWSAINQEIAQNGLNALLGLVGKHISVPTKKPLDEQETFEKIRKYMRHNWYVFAFYFELLVIWLLFALMLVIAALHYGVDGVQFGFAVWASISSMFMLFACVRIISWLTLAHFKRKGALWRSKMTRYLIPNAHELHPEPKHLGHFFWEVGKRSQKLGLLIWILYSIYIGLVSMGLPKNWTNIPFYAVLILGCLWAYYHNTDKDK